MASSIEDILYAKAVAEATAPDMGTSVGVGATGGALLGLIPGDMMHQTGRGVNAAKDLINPQFDGLGDARKFVPRSRRVGTGHRFAGGLVGAIMGGALGAGARDQMIRSSPELQMMIASQQNTGTM